MLRIAFCSTVLAAACLVTPTIVGAAQQAVTADEAVKGFYVGGSVGQARYQNSFTLDNIDRNDTSWKALAGWRFLDQFSAELSYVDFGDTTAPAQLGLNPFAASAKAWTLHAVGYIPIPYVDLFAKAGVSRLEANARGPNFTAFQNDATKFAFGWGVQWRWKSLAVRGEYERFDSNAIGDLELLSLGVTYTLPVGLR